MIKTDIESARSQSNTLPPQNGTGEAQRAFDPSGHAIYVAAESDRPNPIEGIGARIKAARLAKGMTQQALSDALPPEGKKTRAAIAQYEAGGNPPSLQTIKDIAEILGLNHLSLISGEGLPQIGKKDGERIPVKQGTSEGSTIGYASLPGALLDEFGANSSKLELIRLAGDAGAFGARSGDFMLIDADRTAIVADGQLYVIETPAGSALLRAEPFLTTDETVIVTSGQGITATVSLSSLAVLGRLVAMVRKAL